MHEPDEQIPQPLAEVLGGIGRKGPRVTAAIDRAILADARRQLMLSRRRRRIWRWSSAVAAAAAGVLLAWRVALPPDASPPGTQAVAIHPKDINGDGAVDMLDAFALARRIEANRPLNPAWDFTGDGTVHADDVNVVAAAAVRLEQGAAR